MGECSIEGCGKPTDARGWCKAHWKRWKQHGDPMGGGTPKGAAPAFLQAAILTETDECISWPFLRNKKGYGEIRVAGKKRLAHRVICAAVHGEPPTTRHHAAHNCGNGHLGCINPRHLRWATAAENSADQLSHGTIAKGEKHGNSLLTEADVLEIRRLRGSVSHREIAKQFGVTRGAIFGIQSGVTWAWLVPNVPMPRKEWIDHDGGACPVAPETLVKQKFIRHDGIMDKSPAWYKADGLGWDNVTHYRVKKEPRA